MAVYKGLREIAERMGWKSPMTPLRQYYYHGFPLIQRPLANGQRCYITDDTLITKWLEGQLKTPPVPNREPRRHYETCHRCGATVLAPGQSRRARTQRTIQRIIGGD